MQVANSLFSWQARSSHCAIIDHFFIAQKQFIEGIALSGVKR